MNENLAQLIKIYGTQSHKDLMDFIKSQSKKDISSMLVDLLTEYYNDKNSSSLRESLLVSLHGFTRITHKIGYNGYRTSSVNSKIKEYCEVKPKNITTIKDSDNKKPPKKLDGGGNFTDYTWKKFRRHKKENPFMIVGGFIDGKLVYSFKFKFNSISFIKRLEHQLNAKFPNGDVTGSYLRAASFSLKDYEDIKNIQTNVYLSKKELEENSGYLTKRLYILLKEKFRLEDYNNQS